MSVIRAGGIFIDPCADFKHKRAETREMRRLSVAFTRHIFNHENIHILYLLVFDILLSQTLASVGEVALL